MIKRFILAAAAALGAAALRTAARSDRSGGSA